MIDQSADLTEVGAPLQQEGFIVQHERVATLLNEPSFQALYGLADARRLLTEESTDREQPGSNFATALLMKLNGSAGQNMDVFGATLDALHRDIESAGYSEPEFRAATMTRLMRMVNENRLHEVDSSQPDNLRQYEATDGLGNTITYIRDMHGRLETPIEIRDPNGRLLGQSWDGDGWAFTKYIENGVEYSRTAKNHGSTQSEDRTATEVKFTREGEMAADPRTPVIEGVLRLVEANGLKEVESAQPDNLRQYEATDGQGNTITFIRNLNGHLEAPIEVRGKDGKLIAQSWDEQDWALGKYVEAGTNLTLIKSQPHPNTG